MSDTVHFCFECRHSRGGKPWYCYAYVEDGGMPFASSVRRFKLANTETCPRYESKLPRWDWFKRLWAWLRWQFQTNPSPQRKEPG